jgi:hypothetical protein
MEWLIIVPLVGGLLFFFWWLLFRVGKKSAPAGPTGAEALQQAAAGAPQPVVAGPAPETHAVPFVPAIHAGRDEAAQCAKQLNDLIAHMAGQGWRFSHLEDITTLRDNGCLASLFGQGQTVVTFQVAILERL